VQLLLRDAVTDGPSEICLFWKCHTSSYCRSIMQSHVLALSCFCWTARIQVSKRGLCWLQFCANQNARLYNRGNF